MMVLLLLSFMSLIIVRFKEPHDNLMNGLRSIKEVMRDLVPFCRIFQIH